jgi:hypothetical protein
MSGQSQARPLLEAANDPLGLAMLDGTIEAKLVLEHLFAGDDVRSQRTRHERLSPIGLQSIELELYHVAPVGVPESCTHGGRHLRHRGYSRTGIPWVGP